MADNITYSDKTQNNTLSESAVEDMVIDMLKEHGYEHISGPAIAPDAEDSPGWTRADYGEVLLSEILRDCVARLNPTIPEDGREAAVKEIERIGSPDLIVNNETFHRLLTEGIPVTVKRNGVERGDYVRLVDFENPENNDFKVIDQFTVVENNVSKRPDLVLFVNGLPLVVIELKNPASETADIKAAFRQIQTYKEAIPSLFTYNGFVVLSDGHEAKAGTISAGFSRFMAWKSSDGLRKASHLTPQIDTLIAGMLNKHTLLDLLRHFIVFEKTSRTDEKSGLTQTEIVKKLAAYHQYYAVNRAVLSTLRAAGIDNEALWPADVAEKPEHYGLPGVQKQKRGDRKAGVVWHTQGSGKSLSMVFYAGKIVLSLNNPTIVVITDRNDLDDQLFDTFAASRQLLRQEPVQARDRRHLKELLKVASGGVIFTTIQKFLPEEGNVFEKLSDRENIVVIADEAHRTQYGFKAKVVDAKDAERNVIGKKTVYGFAKYMRDALPNATYLGFTGTPIEKDDVNTPAVFGNYIDIYDIAQAVEDGATVRIFYESRLAKINLSEEGKKIIKELDDELGEDDNDASQQAKSKWTRLEALIGARERIARVASDIVTHFENRQIGSNGKAMVVAMSRRIAAQLYQEIIALRPEWHHDDLDKGCIKVVMTTSSSDGPELNRYRTTKEQRRALARRLQDPDDALKIVIVRDMWLTGFDAPILNTMYIDKPMKGHNLMQAIARVNRVYRDKEGGLIVDYLGIASDLKEALKFYSESGGRGDPAAMQQEAVDVMLEKLEVVSQMFHGFAYENYFGADTNEKLRIILTAEDHILGLEDGASRYIREVTALSKAFSIALPHEQAMDARDEISFFQAVKARLVKFEAKGGSADRDIDSVIKQVIDSALTSEQVIDVFDAAGIKKPDISILSEEFLLEVKNMQHKNVAAEVLKKLLKDEIRARSKRNLIQGRTLMEMLEASIRRYHNKAITNVEFLEELIECCKEIQQKDKEPEELGLEPHEYAFYCAVADNESARELMEKEKLRQLAAELFRAVKQNTSIDWTIRENVKAKLRVIIKRTLRKYGYPPDLQLAATDTVLKQAEALAEDLANNDQKRKIG